MTTSEIRITCLIDESRVPKAVRALHKAFELESTNPAVLERLANACTWLLMCAQPIPR